MYLFRNIVKNYESYDRDGSQFPLMKAKRKLPQFMSFQEIHISACFMARTPWYVIERFQQKLPSSVFELVLGWSWTGGT